jgi:hypothetical protein
MIGKLARKFKLWVWIQYGLIKQASPQLGDLGGDYPRYIY